MSLTGSSAALVPVPLWFQCRSGCALAEHRTTVDPEGRGFPQHDVQEQHRLQPRRMVQILVLALGVLSGLLLASVTQDN